jgi:multimeric flavodoxin WrbA
MRIIAFNGSPRKSGNTALLLRETLAGAEQLGADVTFAHIADLEMRGCRGCYGCKLKGKTEGVCVQKDDMTPFYAEIDKADVVLFGTPIYFGAMTPELKMVIDRLFPYMTMDFESRLAPGKRAVVLVTQNQRDPELYAGHLRLIERGLRVIGFESVDFLVSVDTLGFEHMEKLAGKNITRLAARKKKVQQESWPQELAKARDLGRKLAGGA